MQDYVIIVAGGRGQRMNSAVPKQFLPIGGMPVLMRTIEVFHNYALQTMADGMALGIILVLPRAQQDYWKQLCDEYNFAIPHQVADGGETRFHSVQNGLKLVPDDADGVVGVHDGVRPFVSHEVVARCFAAAREHGAAVPAIPVVETVRQFTDASSGTDSHTVDRNLYRLVQTPQTFRISLFKEAMRQPYQEAFTDDASVVEAMGGHISLVEGNRENIKLTTPSDVQYAEFLCQLAH